VGLAREAIAREESGGQRVERRDDAEGSEEEGEKTGPRDDGAGEGADAALEASEEHASRSIVACRGVRINGVSTVFAGF
jgi:hypothetical protein